MPVWAAGRERPAGIGECSIDAAKHCAKGALPVTIRDNAGMMACLGRAIRADLRMAEARHSVGIVKRRMGMCELDCFWQAAKADPNFAMAYGDMAAELDRAGRSRAALDCVDKAASRDTVKSASTHWTNR